MSSYEDIKKEISPETEAILKQFRKNISDVLKPDATDKILLKFLRAKNFNLRKCEEIYRMDRRSKSIFKAEELENRKLPEVIEKYEFANHIGIAKDGTPIQYIAMGRGDLRGFVLSLDVYSIGKYCTRELEIARRRCREQSIKLGKEINEVTYIIDMEYFSLRQAFFSGVTELGFDLFNLLQDLYPEIWKNILIVNVPYYFQTIFNFFKPIFRLAFLQKVHVATRDRTASVLLKYVDADVLPAFLGGERVDSQGDPMCTEFMKFGGIVPEKYYLRNRTPLMPTDPGVEDVWLPPRSCYNYSVVVREANSTILVELRTEGGSILSALYYRTLGPNPDYPDLPGKNEYLDPSNKRCNIEQFVPNIHLFTHVSPIDNYSTAVWPGIYIYKFDNSYNWLTSRRLIFRFRVVPPGEDINLPF